MNLIKREERIRKKSTLNNELSRIKEKISPKILYYLKTL